MGKFQRVPTTYDTDHMLLVHVGIASMGQFQRVRTTYDTDHMLSVHIGIASMGQFQLVPTTYVTEKKGNHFEINAYQVSFPLCVPLYNMSRCRLMCVY